MKFEFVPENIKKGNPVKPSVVSINQLEFDILSLRRTYGVTIVLNDKQPLKIQYKTAIICIGESIDGNYIIEIQKQKTFVDGKEPSTSAELLMEACGNALYPLELEINKKFEILNINNYQAIVDRWKVKKNEIRQSFEGVYAESVLNETTKVIENQESFERKLFNNDWFYVVFFNPIKSKTQKQAYPFIPHKEGVLFELQSKAAYHKKRVKDIIITQKGACIDQRSEHDIRQGTLFSKDVKKFANGVCDINYHIYDETKVIDGVIADIELIFPSEKKEKVHLEIFNLKTQIPKTNTEKNIEQQQQLEQEIKEKKKKKRYFVFGKEVKLKNK